MGDNTLYFCLHNVSQMLLEGHYILTNLNPGNQ